MAGVWFWLSWDDFWGDALGLVLATAFVAWVFWPHKEDR